MEGYPESGTAGEAMAKEWGAHIAASQAEGVEWSPKTGYSKEQLQENATYSAPGEDVASEVVEPEDRKPGEREFGGDSRVLSPVQLVNLGKPVVHSTQEQPAGDDNRTHQVPGGVIDSY